MKIAIVMFSQLGDCWSAHRHFDECHLCNRPETCKRPEAARGRLKLRQQALVKLEENIKEKKLLLAHAWIETLSNPVKREVIRL